MPPHPESNLNREEVLNRLVRDFSFVREGFSDPIPWTDHVGFSRVKEFPDDHASLYKIGFLNKELTSGRNELRVSVSYGKKIGEGISVGTEEGLFKPVDLEYKGDFFYDTATGLYYYREKVVTPQYLFELVQEKHEQPTKLGRGFYMRNRLWFWRKLLPWCIKFIDQGLIGLLWLFSGAKVKTDVMGRLLDIHLERIERPISAAIEFTKGSTMDFFGYKAKRWSVVFYCLVHLMLYVIYKWVHFRHPWLTQLFNNTFLALCYTVVTFAITEALIPAFLEWVIVKINPRVFESVVFKTLKI